MLIGQRCKAFSLSACLLAAGAVAPSIASAKPWIGPNELDLRHHIELLSSTGIITAPTTQWPLMWGSILPDLKRAQARNISALERQALDALLARFEQERKPFSASIELAHSEQERRFLTGFGDSNNAPEYGAVSAEFMSSSWAGELRLSYDIPDAPREHRRLDGSYLARAFGNWGVTLGAIDRWWGAGWQSSLLLSNNARPVPGISLQRNRAHEFETPLLSWLGPWQLQAFAGQLEGERTVPGAKLLGMRVAVKPAQWLEIAASRTAQWGGDGRDENFSSFKDLMLGNDNRGDGGLTQENEPGNQLAGFDVKMLWATPWGNQGAYIQHIGEDESGYQPSRLTHVVGLNGLFAIEKHRLHWFLERTQTTAGALIGDERSNYVYEHDVYKNGYRYKGRAIGASIDNDSELDTLGLDWMLPDGSRWSLRYSDVALNIDGGGRKGSPASRSQGEGNTLEISYSQQFGGLNAEVGYIKVDDGLQLYNYDHGIESAFIEARYRW
ncbi:capsule assembly Wzi family protein [Spongiibacter marinus]|uniref:capsule assembly Wzi family protein n=1 Tax=Spongiibacter marinus TaxID=354246 RepID=UPI0035666FA2